MQPVEILKDLFFIERGYLNANHFVYRSDKAILIDSAYIADFDETASAIRSLGVDPSTIDLIINTHCHCDHIGGNKAIQDLSGCKIAMHKIGKHFIDTRDDWSTWWQYYQQDAEFFNCTHELNDGDGIAFGPHRFVVIHTPGHAPDGLVLYSQKHKLLISADTLWENDLAVMTVRVEGMRALFDTLDSYDKIEALDVDTVYPGHGKPFTGFHAALAKSRTRIQRFLNKRELIGQDILKKIIVYTVMMRREVPEDDFFTMLMHTHWFRETVDLFFNGEYELKYKEIIASFIERRILLLTNGRIRTTAKP